MMIKQKIYTFLWNLEGLNKMVPIPVPMGKSWNQKSANFSRILRDIWLDSPILIPAKGLPWHRKPTNFSPDCLPGILVPEQGEDGQQEVRGLRSGHEKVVRRLDRQARVHNRPFARIQCPGETQQGLDCARIRALPVAIIGSIQFNPYKRCNNYRALNISN